MKLFALPSRVARVRSAALAAVWIAGAAGSPFERVAAHAQTPVVKNKATHVSAVYQIVLNGFDIGNFRYTSEVNGPAYALTSDVELSLLMGAFHWKGVSRTSGTATSAGPRPASFGFDYTSSLKDGSVRMGFTKGTVDTISIEPPAAPVPDTVALKPEHLANVLDPLTAILSLTQDTGSKPCDRKLAIFDGKQRFDLQLVYLRQDPIEGTSETASVCRVRYIPIAGFRATEETANLARTTGIEISFRQVVGAKLLVPQKVLLPTLAGAAEISVQHVDIDTPGSGQVALVND